MRFGQKSYIYTYTHYINLNEASPLLKYLKCTNHYKFYIEFHIILYLYNKQD